MGLILNRIKKGKSTAVVLENVCSIVTDCWGEGVGDRSLSQHAVHWSITSAHILTYGQFGVFVEKANHPKQENDVS